MHRYIVLFIIFNITSRSVFDRSSNDGVDDDDDDDDNDNDDDDDILCLGYTTLLPN